LIGAGIKFYDTLPAPNVGHVKLGAESHAWFTWADILAPHAGTRVAGTYADQYYAGEAAVIARRLGKGTVTYVGADSASGSLEAEAVRSVYAEAKVPVENFAEGFLVDWRDGVWIATNSTERVQAAPIAAGGKPLIGQRDVPVAGVTVWCD
jgi:beta-galactosidase